MTSRPYVGFLFSVHKLLLTYTTAPTRVRDTSVRQRAVLEVLRTSHDVILIPPCRHLQDGSQSRPRWCRLTQTKARYRVVGFTKHY